MRANRNHLHYFLLDAGLRDLQAVGVILSVNMLFVLAAYLIQGMGSRALFIVLCVMSAIFFTIVFFVRRKHKRMVL